VESEPQAVRVLKRDALGSVERIERGGTPYVRRLAVGGRLPGSGLVARVLLRRERAALRALAGLSGVPQLVEDRSLVALEDADGRRPTPAQVLVRTWVEGEPLHRARELPLDFFDQLDLLVAALHERGVCHNDLHKEQNVVVDERGYPALIDFQLASRHPPGSRSRAFASRAADDLRHVQKHRRRYTRDERGPAAASERHGAGFGLRRSPLARAWKRLAKPVYLRVTRRFGLRDAEPRRPSSGPWPRWVAARGPRDGSGLR